MGSGNACGAGEVPIAEMRNRPSVCWPPCDCSQRESQASLAAKRQRTAHRKYSHVRLADRGLIAQPDSAVALPSTAAAIGQPSCEKSAVASASATRSGPARSNSALGLGGSASVRCQTILRFSSSSETRPVLQPPFEVVVGAIPDREALERRRASQVDFPPGVAFLGRVRDRFLVEVAVGLAVDCPFGRRFEVGARLARLAFGSDVLRRLRTPALRPATRIFLSPGSSTRTKRAGTAAGEQRSRGDRDFVEHEVAARTARAAAGQALVREYFQAKRGNVFQLGHDRDFVRIVLGTRPSGQHRTIRQDFKARPLDALDLDWTQ